MDPDALRDFLQTDTHSNKRRRCRKTKARANTPTQSFWTRRKGREQRTKNQGNLEKSPLKDI